MLKKIFLAGIGTVATTYERASELVDDMVKKGSLTVGEGKELSEELKRDFKNKASDTTNKIINTIDDVKLMTKDEVKSLIESYEFAYAAEVELLRKKVVELEIKLSKIENKEEN